MNDVAYGDKRDISAAELAAFYRRLGHPIAADEARIAAMIEASTVFVTARIDGELIGIARGLTDGVRGYLTECKLDPRYQGPAAVTRSDGRIEDDQYGIARTLAEKVLEALEARGAERIDALAYTTEVDFLSELGFRHDGGAQAMIRRAAAAEPALSAGRG